MARVYEKAYFNNTIIPFNEANLSIASSAVLYGLSVYTVFPITVAPDGRLLAFRLEDHFRRLINSSRIIGINTFEPEWTFERFVSVIKKLIAANTIREDTFVRVTVHVDELVAGTRSRDLHTNLSIFVYEATPIVPQTGARLKTSVWRRIPDFAIPSRAKVNGAYVNSVLAKQDAIDSGYDDCIFLDVYGHVCELSAANIFLVRDGILITPDTHSDLLEGINRKTVLEIAHKLNISVAERSVDLTELYVADEVFTSGTSAFIAPIIEIDARTIHSGTMGDITSRIRTEWQRAHYGEKPYEHLVTTVGKKTP